MAAHSKEELKEWKDRMEYRKKKLRKANRMYGKTFVDSIVDRLAVVDSAADEAKFWRERLDDVHCVCSRPLNEPASGTKSERMQWLFELTTRRPLLQVGLIHSEFKPYFAIASVKHSATLGAAETKVTQSELSSAQEWSHPDWQW